MRTILLLMTLSCTALCINAMSIEPSMKFDHNASLVANDIYNMFWNVNGDEITFEVHVKTLGYVGFGFSKTGGMRYADVVIGWVKDGEVYFQDRYSERNAEPQIDESQDWKILEGREEGEYTILKFSRAMKNCDPNDIDVTDETMRVIYAFHEDDPVESTGLPYHGRNYRGTKSFSFIVHTSDQEQILPADAISMDFVVENIEIPAEETTYYCHGFKIPKLDRKHHVVMMEPIIQAGNEGLVHHMLLYSCSGKMKEDIHNQHGDCELKRMQDMRRKCVGTLFVYAIGVGNTFLPKETGVPLGGEDAMTHFRLEIHYDNPLPSPAGLVDSSGMRLWLSPTLREYDAWLFITGMPVLDYQVIPPHFDSMTNVAYCPSQCLTAAMNGTEASEGIKVFAAAVHTHLLGTKIKLRHFRDGVELPPIIKDDYYDFNYQYMKVLEEPIVVKPNDDLVTECTYNSEERENVTFGGYSTRQEMCFVFIMYYPRLSNFNSCLSMISPTTTMEYTGAEIKFDGRNADSLQVVGEEYEGKKWREIVRMTDWSNQTTRENFQKAIVNPNAYTTMICSAHPRVFWTQQPFKIKKTYEEPNPCDGKTNSASSVPFLFAIINQISLFVVKITL